MTRITIILNDEEKKALRALADGELRDPRDQVVFIIRTELKRLGMIEITNSMSNPPACDHAADEIKKSYSKGKKQNEQRPTEKKRNIERAASFK